MVISKINMSIFKDEVEVLSQEDFLKKAEGKSVVTVEGLAKYVQDIEDLVIKGETSDLTPDELASVEAADSCIKALECVRFVDEEGKENDVFLMKAEKDPKDGIDEKSLDKKKKEIEEDDEDDEEEDDEEDEDAEDIGIKVKKNKKKKEEAAAE